MKFPSSTVKIYFFMHLYVNVKNYMGSLREYINTRMYDGVLRQVENYMFVFFLNLFFL